MPLSVCLSCRLTVVLDVFRSVCDLGLEKWAAVAERFRSKRKRKGQGTCRDCVLFSFLADDRDHRCNNYFTSGLHKEIVLLNVAK